MAEEIKTEAEQMQENYDRQQEVAQRKPVPHRPDIGTEQGEHNVPQEELDKREADRQQTPVANSTQGGSPIRASERSTGTRGGRSGPSGS